MEFSLVYQPDGLVYKFIIQRGVCNGVVIKALYYKKKGRGFENRRGE
jgi:hypothetical protein